MPGAAIAVTRHDRVNVPVLGRVDQTPAIQNLPAVGVHEERLLDAGPEVGQDDVVGQVGSDRPVAVPAGVHDDQFGSHQFGFAFVHVGQRDVLGGPSVQRGDRIELRRDRVEVAIGGHHRARCVLVHLQHA